MSDTATPPEILTPALTRQLIYEGQIVVFTISNISRATVDAWAAAVTETVESWDSDYPLLTMYDFLPTKNLTFTPYLRQKSTQVTGLRRDLHGRSALILPNSFMIAALQLFLKARYNPVRARQIFHHSEEGLAWLVEGLRKT